MKKTTYIIAEAGVNHNGSMDLAKKLIDTAKECGANAVKFQTFKTEENISRNAPKAEYQIKNTGTDESQYEMIKKLELSFNQFKELYDYCQLKNIEFLSTPFDFPSIDFLISLGLDTFKIPSGEITNLPYLKKIASLRKKIILSTGMATMEEIEQAMNILLNGGCKKEEITILHCTTEYPAPFKDVNLFAMNSIKEKFNVSVGYSDHTKGIEIPIAAVALGARIIEKHFTMDKTLEGPDHLASLDPTELKSMIDAIRNVELSLGDGHKSPSESEIKNIKIARKSIHLKNGLKKGQVISPDDLCTRRPGIGISPMEIEDVIGKKVNCDLKAESILLWEYLK